MPAKTPPPSVGRPQFQTTAWTVVLSAAQEGAPGAQGSMAELCRTYWQPIYAFILHQRHPVPDAEDLTQGFFAHLLVERTLTRAERARGRFRSFLLGALRRFLADQAGLLNAQKRGAGWEFISLNTIPDPEIPVATDLNAEQLFEAQWARALLDAALARLRAEWAAGVDKAAALDALLRFLPGAGTPPPSYRETATELGISEAALKSLVHRLRTRYREALRREVARTVPAPHEVDDEIRHLCAAAALLGGGGGAV